MRWSGRSFVAAVAVLGSGCGSDPSVVAPFREADCHGQLVEMARFAQTYALANDLAISNSLAIDGGSLYLAYSFAGTTSGVPVSGGIVAVALSGGAPRVVAAADPAQTSEWLTDAFWVAGGQIFLQTGQTLASLPADPATPSPLSVVLPPDGVQVTAYAHDAQFAYAAISGGAGVGVTKFPLDGSAPTSLAGGGPGSAPLGGMADAGDALLLQLRGSPGSPTTGQPTGTVWRIPKDGSPGSQLRPDVDWADPQTFTQFLAWDGQEVIAPIVVQNEIVVARVPVAGTSAPVETKLYGTIATRRGDEVLTFQPMYAPSGALTNLVVASSKGAPAGTVVACAASDPAAAFFNPVGIAANDDEIFVAYLDGHDTVIAQVVP